jgi:hypothetical protein
MSNRPERRLSASCQTDAELQDNIIRIQNTN